jgi:hypothetical protein
MDEKGVRTDGRGVCTPRGGCMYTSEGRKGTHARGGHELDIVWVKMQTL